MTYIELLKNLLISHFDKCNYQENNSLLECDFLDTYSNYIVDYLSSYKIDVFSMKQWGVEEQQYISKSIEDHGKYIDPYIDWRDVPITYLVKYVYGINYLKPTSYKFYIQSLIWNYVNKRDIFIKQIDFLEPWLNSLNPLNEDFSIDDHKTVKFSKINSVEGILIAFFLFCLYHDPLVPEDTKSMAKDINYSYWMTRKYTLS